MQSYINLFFVKGPNADEYLSIIREHGHKKTIEYILRVIPWPPSVKPSEKHPWVSSDDRYIMGESHEDQIVLFYDSNLRHLGLTLVQNDIFGDLPG